MHGDVIGPIALDLVLGFLFAGMAWMSLVHRLMRVDLDDPAAHAASFGIPAHMVADFELHAHALAPPFNSNRSSTLGAAQPTYTGLCAHAASAATRRIVSSASESDSEFPFAGKHR